MTVLRGIDFGPCWDAPGVRGWFGEGYWYHRIPPLSFWLSCKGSARVAKTTTCEARIPPQAGNMPIGGKKNLWGPLEYFPRCIWFNLRDGRTLNSVSLTEPGAAVLLEHGLVEGTEPFMISFMATADSPAGRLEQFRRFIILLLAALLTASGRGKIALQINISCPNTGLDTKHLADEALGMLDLASRLTAVGVPVIVKVNVLASLDAVVEIAAHPNCDALCVSNALPFGELPHAVAWPKLFPKGSPLKNRNQKFGGGGYSGPELLKLTGDFIAAARLRGVQKPWNAGGGIRSARDVDHLVKRARLRPGIDSIFFASAAMARPWNVPSIIRRSHQLLG